MRSLIKGMTTEELEEADKFCSSMEAIENLYLIDLHSNRGDVDVSLRNSKL